VARRRVDLCPTTRPQRAAIAFVALFFPFAWTSPAFAATSSAAVQPKTILVLPFDFVDTSIIGIPHMHSLPADIARVHRTTQIARHAVDKLPGFRVISTAKVRSAIRKAQNTYRYLHECNGCDVDIGHKAGADLVMTGWVQKVSNLILSINATIRSVATGKEVGGGSVSIRGDTDTSWADGTRYMIRHPLLQNYHSIEAAIAKRRASNGGQRQKQSANERQ
jgi:hypothetical protein